MSSYECIVCFAVGLNEGNSEWVRFRCGHTCHKSCAAASPDPKQCGQCRATSRNFPQDTRLPPLTQLPSCVNEIIELELNIIIKFYLIFRMKNRLERENLEAKNKLQEKIKCLKQSKKTIAHLKSKIQK